MGREQMGEDRKGKRASTEKHGRRLKLTQLNDLKYGNVIFNFKYSQYFT